MRPKRAMDLGPDDSPATHHSWRRTQRNTRGSTKKADDDDEEPCAGVENATTTRRVTGHTTGQQHQDGVRGNGDWGLGGKRTLCQTRCKDHHRHGVELRTNAEGANVVTGRDQACEPMKQLPRTSYVRSPLWGNNRSFHAMLQPTMDQRRTRAMGRDQHEVQRRPSHVGGLVWWVDQTETT